MRTPAIVFLLICSTSLDVIAKEKKYETGVLVSIERKVSTHVVREGTTGKIEAEEDPTLGRITGTIELPSETIEQHVSYLLKIRTEKFEYHALWFPTWILSKFPVEELVEGTNVQMRVEKGKLFLRRTNGKEIKTRLIKKVALR
ncbi:MAG: hypothetical protein L0Z53_17210 [Acidobacteriales bacterium]|nr:hypothetical protein [Terriglobales bacterium]